MKTMHRLLLVFSCLALLAFSGCTDKKETVQPEPGWQVIDFVWTKETGDKMTLSVTVPEEWDKDSVRKEGRASETFFGELYIDDKNALKQAGSHGIIAVLGELCKMWRSMPATLLGACPPSMSRLAIRHIVRTISR